MVLRTRKNHLPEFKVEFAMAAICGDKTLADLAQPVAPSAHAGVIL